ncbi:MAG: hypothetical protein AAF512_03045 [Pseudomonadota bacterium]
MEQTVSKIFSDLDTSADIFDEQLLPFFESWEELIYEVRTPTQAEHDNPPGVLIYISPKPGAKMPTAWGEVLDKHNLIWVGAQNSGNEVHVARRVGFALLASEIAAAQVDAIDTSRIFLTGFSGGGRVASMMMPEYPERFAGTIFICGANPMFNAPQDVLDTLAQVPMVFLTGTGDFNLEDTKMAISTYQYAGLDKAQLMVVDGLGHALPEAQDLDTALQSFVLSVS